jgi:hypothetical protein
MNDALKKEALKELARRELARRQGQPAPEAAAAVAEPQDPGLGTLGSLQYGLQNVGEGIANVLGAPVDLVSGAANAGIAATNFAGGSLVPGWDKVPFIEDPIGGSQSIKDLASMFFPTIDESQVPPKQQIAGSMVDFGTQALLPGAALAASAGRQAAAAPSMVQRSPVAQSIVDNFTRGMTQPYVANASRTLTGDVVAAGGAGGAVEAYDQYAPESVQDSLGAIGPLIAALVGGTGAATGKALVEGAAGATMNAGRSLTGTQYDPNIPMDEATGYRPTRNELDQAAMIAQGQASNPALAARTIEEEAAGIRQIQPSVAVPTSGALSGDVGLNLYENTKRVADAAPFIRRTQAVNTGANDLIGRSAPPDAEPRAVTDFAETTTNQRIGQADTQAQQAITDLEANAGQRRQQIEARRPARQDAPINVAQAEMAPASGRLQEAFTGEYTVSRNRKNTLYNDPAMVNAPVDPEPLYDAVQSIQGGTKGPLSIGGGLPGEIVQRVRNLVVATDPDTGAPVAFRDITYGDIQDLRAAISEEIAVATRASADGASGSGPRVQALRNLREVLDGYPDDLADSGNDAARAAIDNYSTDYRPRFREGQAGNVARDITRDPSNQRPEDFAGKFLGQNKGSDVESLDRAINLRDMPERAADARTWLTGKLASTGVVDPQTGILRPDTLRKWAGANREVISRVPGMQNEIDRMLAQATQGREMTGRIADELRALDAEVAGQRTAVRQQNAAARKQVETSTIGQMRGKNPTNAVDGVFNSGDPERAMEELILEIGPDKKASDGLKASVRDWLIDKTSTTAVEKTVDGERPTSFAKLENLFNQHEKTLAKVYSPEEMNALRDAHRLLKPMNNLRNRGTTGSDSAEKGAMGWKVLEAGLKARYGVLKGGGLLRTIRIAAETLPNSRSGVDMLTKKMFFDPDLAVFLLRREIKPDSPEWNAKLQRLIGFGAAARESTASDDDNAGK